MTLKLLYNGGFNGNMYRWSGTGTINRIAGYPRIGCASLAAGQSIASEVIGLGENYPYTIHFFYQLATGATLTAGYGSVVTQTFTGSPLNVWREGVITFALDTGGNSGVTFAASGGACLVDSVTLMGGGLPISRADIAVMVADNLGSLATDAGLSTTASAAGPNGDYSLNIDDALRAMGAVSTFGGAGLLGTYADEAVTTWGDPDVTQLEMAEIGSVVELVTESLIVQIRNSKAGEVDITLGPRSERKSQLVANMNALLGGGKGKGGASGKSVGVGKLTNNDWPR